MIQINLLPHRERRRATRRIEFYVMAALAFSAAVVVVFIGSVWINSSIDSQNSRNNFIKGENAKLDEQIKEIADLKQEIDSLNARQQAVEDLQSDRNLPVHLLDELVKQVPEGIYLMSVKQNVMKVTLVGIAQSNDRVSELLRNLSNNSAWLEGPELAEIKSTTVGTDKHRAYQFTMSVNLKRPAAPAKDATGKPIAAATPGTTAPAAAPSAAPVAAPSAAASPAAPKAPTPAAAAPAPAVKK
jgi:type IV pilus assembly protein PilN